MTMLTGMVYFLTCHVDDAGRGQTCLRERGFGRCDSKVFARE
ncbi:hypothetical protein SFHH103_00237 [Sinorhizobium fredii HH103]|uniref:Uncharacterized protein n=1 Tax=Sinorhizobium fredii (strain HH103) TaxID=1117943 RepID=G9AAW1_SINF1|nr:hypothetical protein SFHH103_00237 [Sinorhizobium fredii HH103]